MCLCVRACCVSWRLPARAGLVKFSGSLAVEGQCGWGVGIDVGVLTPDFPKPRDFNPDYTIISLFCCVSLHTHPTHALTVVLSPTALSPARASPFNHDVPMYRKKPRCRMWLVAMVTNHSTSFYYWCVRNGDLEAEKQCQCIIYWLEFYFKINFISKSVAKVITLIISS